VLSPTGALLVGAGLASASGLAWWRAGRWRVTCPYLNEATLLSLLYAGWQLLLDGLVKRTAGAVAHGRWVWAAERSVHLPSEASLQRLLLRHTAVMGAGNLYYAGVHFVAMGLFLGWVFTRHRHRYGPLRWQLAGFTALAALVQAVPVAPPRLVPGLGVVDAAARLGESVYPAHGLSDPGQLIAMPSVHVGWAALIAVGTLTLSPSRWRWVGPAHLLTTFTVVVATGNHYWLDGLAAMALLAGVTAVTGRPGRGGPGPGRIETTVCGDDNPGDGRAGPGGRGGGRAGGGRSDGSGGGVAHAAHGAGGR
jgi:hypothetical protein